MVQDMEPPRHRSPNQHRWANGDTVLSEEVSANARHMLRRVVKEGTASFGVKGIDLVTCCDFFQVSCRKDRSV